MNRLEDLSSATTTWRTPDGSTLPLTQRGAGPATLVLIPGALCDYRVWTPQFEHFSRTMRCVTLGRRDLNEPARFDIWQQAWDISAYVRQQAEQTCFLVAHSFGSLAALVANELLPGRVAGIVLIDAPLSESDLMTAPIVDELKLGRRAIVEQAVASMTETLPAPLRDEVRSMMLSMPSEVAAGMLSRAEQFIPDLAPRIALAERTGLLAFWRQDNAATPRVPAIAPRARHRVVAGGHFIQLEQPEMTNELIEEFIRERLKLADLDIAV
jgi:pimeloyl-ACP methyl ester carboxylesterase